MSKYIPDALKILVLKIETKLNKTNPGTFDIIVWAFSHVKRKHA